MKALLVAVLALTGCYFKTKDTLVETPVSQPTVSTTIVPAEQPAVVAKTKANVIALRVEMPRQCFTQAVQNFEVTRGKEATLDWSIYLVPLGFIVPVTFALIPAVTGIVSVARAKRNDESATETRVISRNSYACALRLSDQVVQVHFPSGATFEVRTNRRGIASVTIPDEEVDHGTARIELATVTRTIDYDRRGYDVEQLAIEVDE